MSDEPHHIYELFDPSKFVAAFELSGKDTTVTIDHVSGEIIEGENARKSKKPVIHLKDWPKPLVLNKTNAKVLIALYGADYRKWNGKRFTMYPTTTKMAGEEVDAIRLRKKAPAAPSAPAPSEPPRTEKSLAERVESLEASLKGATTKDSVKAWWDHKRSKDLRAELLKHPDAKLLENLTLIYESRMEEVQE